jgi:hypothetical protein
MLTASGTARERAWTTPCFGWLPFDGPAGPRAQTDPKTTSTAE